MKAETRDYRVWGRITYAEGGSYLMKQVEENERAYTAEDAAAQVRIRLSDEYACSEKSIIITKVAPIEEGNP